MAAKKQDPKAAEKATDDAGGKGGGKKMIIIFAVVLLLAVGGSVGGTLYFLSGEEAAPDDEATAEAAPVFTEALYNTLRPAFVVNYTIANKPRYLQTELAIMSRNPAVIDAVTAHGPLIRARLLQALSAQNFLDLQTQSGKEALQVALLAEVNAVLTDQNIAGEAEGVLFSSFVMQ
ncbi:MAG: flagellar basal body-associated FliL family protein [Pseudomonadales bacterium]|nr:flagellar basal body-associated FliL family protein [Pseudomonadales bacterium]